MTNFDLCEKMFSALKKMNVKTVIICAGARNAPLIENLSEVEFKTLYFFEERSAAFYALGLMQQTGNPVAVMTTSGTAAAELLPATIESFYQGLPLILITADRPKHYRGTGSPQTINQVGIFSHYVEQTFDWDCTEKVFAVQTALQSPIHFNICFDEPLLDAASCDLKPVVVEIKMPKRFPVATRLDWSQIKNPLLIIGQIPISKKNNIIQLILRLQAPVYLEALSQLQGNPDIASFVIASSEALIKKFFRSGHCESVVRIGGIPTVRIWRDLEFQMKEIPVYNITDLPWTGLSRSSFNFQLDLSSIVEPLKNKLWDELKAKDLHLQGIKNSLYKQFPHSEQTYVHNLSTLVASDPIYLGNSLPIREWDLFSNQHLQNKKDQKFYANRGVNGIDGQVSTYLGWSHGTQRSWCFIGDLTAMYDLASLGLAPLELSRGKRIVVMNNHGGQIFRRVFKKPQFLNSHQIEFKGWAEMWNWNYLKISTSSDFQAMTKLTHENTIIEILPDPEQTDHFWSQWDLACNEI